MKLGKALSQRWRAATRIHNIPENWWELMKESWISILELLGLSWWVEIEIESPRCIYYFGPFITAKEAKAAQSGYIEDLQQEGAKGIKVEIKRCKPSKLTVFEEADEEIKQSSKSISPILTGQL